MPPEGLESSVDGLGRPVRAVGVVEEREDVRHAAFEGASERDESGASGRRSPDSEGFDELGHHAPSLPTVLLRVAGSSSARFFWLSVLRLAVLSRILLPL